MLIPYAICIPSKTGYIKARKHFIVYIPVRISNIFTKSQVHIWNNFVVGLVYRENKWACFDPNTNYLNNKYINYNNIKIIARLNIAF